MTSFQTFTCLPEENLNEKKNYEITKKKKKIYLKRRA